MKQSDDLGLFNALIAASAASGNLATVPDTQPTAGDGSASIALGFPPETFIDRAAGGSPPRGADMNGFLNRLSRAIQVLQAGYVGPFNATFAQSIGGYPAGAIVSGSTPGLFWVSTADSNVTTPGASGATWRSLFDGYLTAAIAKSTYVQKSGDKSTGSQYSAGWFWGGYGAGWGGSTTSGQLRWTVCGVSFGNPGGDASPKYSGNLCVTDVLNDGSNNESGINMRGYDSAGTLYNWFYAWNGNITTPKGLVAFQSDLSGYVANTNTGISGAISGTSLCINPSDGRAYFAYSGNTQIAALAWYADVTAETTARVNADNNLQAQVSAKQPAGNYVTGLSAGKIMQDFVVAVEGSGVHDITFPQAFSGTPTTIVISHGLTNGSNDPVSVLSGWTATGFQIQTNGSTSVNFLAVGPA
ncbi:hypothetical protein [Acetobacter oryzifermentans]|uniref:hypothetical protein n=1 Tax=Acetobacter oryzifermentans TaxID=1633874 RepID=UPI0007B07D4B|nr:hypothetical protein [Acetobacter oryzifermentans]